MNPPEAATRRYSQSNSSPSQFVQQILHAAHRSQIIEVLAVDSVFFRGIPAEFIVAEFAHKVPKQLFFGSAITKDLEIFSGDSYSNTHQKCLPRCEVNRVAIREDSVQVKNCS